MRVPVKQHAIRARPTLYETCGIGANTRESAMNSLKSAGGLVGGIVLILAVIAIPILLLRGMVEVSLWALDWIPGTIGWATLAAVVLAPLAVIPASRGAAGPAYSLVAIIYLVCLWLYAMAVTYVEWGMVGLVVGIMLAGVGVIFTGFLAAIFAGEGTVVLNIVIMFVFVLATNFLGAWLSELALRRKLMKEEREEPSGVTIIQHD